MERVHTASAPAAIGPYSQATLAAGLVFTAGQIGLDPGTGKIVEGGIEAQTERVMANLSAVLAAAGSGFGRVVHASVYLTDLGDFPLVNEIYGRHLGEHRPARTTVGVASLPLGASIEIAMIACGQA